MMDVLSENIHAVTNLAGVPLRKVSKFWTAERINFVRDSVLAAITDRRSGDTRAWDRLVAMEPSEWIDWLQSVTQNSR